MNRPVLKVKPCEDGGLLWAVDVPPGDLAH